MKTMIKLIKCFPVLLTILFFIGCHGETKQQEQNNLSEIEVSAEEVKKETRVSYEALLGTVRSRQKSVISANISAKISKIHVSPGGELKEGDLIAELEEREILAKVSQAEALHSQAATDLRRYQMLLSQGAVTRSEFDGIQARERVTRAALSEAETLLAYTKIRAPFSGVVTQKFTEVGDLASPGKPLFEIVAPMALRLEVEVPESLVGQIKIGDQLKLVIAALQQELKGIVSEIVPVADPNSRTFLAKVTIPESGDLITGLVGHLHVPVGEIETVRVPVSSLIKRGQLEFVFVIKDNRAQLRLIRSGKVLGQEVEIISGLEPGERVVTSQVLALRDCQPVKELQP